MREQFLHPVHELPDLLLGVGVVQAHHRDEVLARLELAQRLAADALAGRIRRDEIGKLFLQVQQLAVKFVVVAVGNHRLGLDVVEVVVLADFLDQFGVTGFGLRFGHAIRITRVYANSDKSKEWGKSEIRRPKSE